MDIQVSKFNVEWLPKAGEAPDPDLVAYESARRDTETVMNELRARGYKKAEIMRGVGAALGKFAESTSS